MPDAEPDRETVFERMLAALRRLGIEPEMYYDEQGRQVYILTDEHIARLPPKARVRIQRLKDFMPPTA